MYWGKNKEVVKVEEQSMQNMTRQSFINTILIVDHL